MRDRSFRNRGKDGAPIRRVPPVFALIAVVMGFLAVGRGGAQDAVEALLLRIEGPIGPAISDYVVRGIEAAGREGAAAVVITMDTPGGLDTSMRDIIKAILASRAPVLSYVSPSGARAASAGTYILYASHVAAMAPGTNLGAATPVQIGGGIMPGEDEPEGGAGDEEAGEEAAKKPAKPTLADKAVSDAVAYIRSLAQLRGRNVDWAERAVLEAASLPAEEALKENVIDIVASDLRDLLRKADGRTVKLADREVTLETAELTITAREPDWRTEFLATLTNPNVAYILLMLGVYGLFIEFSNPGIVLPGVVGVTSLLLALFAFQLLPVNYVGLALIALGIGLMTAEAFVPAFGALGIGGLVSLVIGSIMLIDTDVPGFAISPVLIGAVAVATGGLFLFVITMAMRAWRHPVVTGAEGMLGNPGEVVSWDGRRGRVHTHGEIWQAEGPEGLETGDGIRVTAIKGLKLEVAPLAGHARLSPEAGDGSPANEGSMRKE